MKNADIMRASHQEAAQVLARAESWPQFKDNWEDIEKAMEADHSLSLHDAYIQVVVPKIGSEARQSTLQDISHKATASALRPGNGSPSVPVTASEQSWTELLKQEWGRQSR